MTSKADLTRQVKVALANPYELASVLGLVNVRSQKQLRGVIVNCPAHKDTGRPNCSITVAKDGTARVKCHACGFKGDAITLVAVVHGLDLKKEFKRALRLAAELAGQDALADEIGDGVPRPERIHLPEPRQLPEAPWPDRVDYVWDSCLPIHNNSDAVSMLDGRGIDPYRVERRNLARVLSDAPLPSWASFGKRNWKQTGHRLLVRAFDSCGNLKSLRAWRVIDGETPKRLPPSGCKSAGLVLADRLGWLALTEQSAPDVLWVVEGEPDWLAASLAAPGGHAVLGIGSGSWSVELAKKLRGIRRIMVATHPDLAGDRYAAHIISGATSFEKDSANVVDKSADLMVPHAVRWRPEKDLDLLGASLQAHMGTASKWSRIPHALGD